MAKNFQGIFRSLMDKGSRFSFTRELITDLAQKHFANSLRDQEFFDGVVLQSDLVNEDGRPTAADASAGTAIRSPSIWRVYVRPLDIHDLLVPEPCKFKDQATRDYCISLHPVALSEQMMEDGSGNHTISPGDIVRCTYNKGPDNREGMKSLRFNPNRVGIAADQQGKTFNCDGKIVDLVNFSANGSQRYPKRLPNTSRQPVTETNERGTIKKRKAKRNVRGVFPIANIEAVDKACTEMGITNRYAKIAYLSVCAKESSIQTKGEYMYTNTDYFRIMKLFGGRLTVYSESKGWDKAKQKEMFSLRKPKPGENLTSSHKNDRFTGEKNPTAVQKNNILFYDIIYGYIAASLPHPTKKGKKALSPKYKHDKSGDGWNYRGKGLNQITFKSTYEKIGKIIGYDLVGDPDILLTDPFIAAKAGLALLLPRITRKAPRYGGLDVNEFTNQYDANIAFARANAGWGKRPSRFENGKDGGKFYPGNSYSVDGAINSTWNHNPWLDELYPNGGNTLVLPSANIKKKNSKMNKEPYRNVSSSSKLAKQEVHLQGILIPERKSYARKN